MSHPTSLILRAGPKAIAAIRRDGLQPGHVAVVPGAAGGPKALGIIGLDHALFGEWLPRVPRVRDLIGASIGAWRFAAVCRGDIAAALKDFADIYCGQRYPPRPSARMVSESAHNNTRELLGGREEAVLSHPHYRLHVIATRGLGLMARQSRIRTPAGFAVAALVNAVGRHHLRHVADRMWFHDARGMPAFLGGAVAITDSVTSHGFDSFRTVTAPLNAANLHPALWASAAIPMVMEGVDHVSGAPPGTYWDGGIIDYHLHLPYHRADGITLYPHFTDRIVPGWLDKPMPWRRAKGQWLENLLLVSPSPEYLASLPHRKLPDRSDFKRFEHDGDARERYWRRAMAESERLGDEFLRLADSGEIGSRLLPL
ncbi:MAG: patatin-like phospholipase family protein [Betaproteobacteria bacterium]